MLEVLVTEVVVDLFGDCLVGGHLGGINFFYIYKQQLCDYFILIRVL